MNFSVVLCIICSVFLSQDCFAQKKTVSKTAKTHPAFVEVKDTPGLPRVLLIGDSISMGYTIPVRKALAGKANVHRPAENCHRTIDGLENMEKWLGDGKWDVIHFNFGIHDMTFVEGKVKVPLKQYEENLVEITTRLKKTGAKLIWCSTTPTPKGARNGRTNENVLAYNAVAKKIMENEGIAIDDLYTFALKNAKKKIQRPADVHFTDAGSQVLARQVSAEILKQLKSPAK